MNNLLAEIKRCQTCLPFLINGINPVVSAHSNSKIVIIGQAPGSIVHKSSIPWDDKSGERLRQWLGVDEATFYNPEIFALIPMGFCYPGKGKTGDLPPRKECAPLWHKKILDKINNIELVILIGSYAQEYYLGKSKKRTLTETIDYIKDIQETIDLLENRKDPVKLEKLQKNFLNWVAYNNSIPFAENNQYFNKEQLIKLSQKIFDPSILKFGNFEDYPLFRLVKSFPVDFVSANVYGDTEYKYRSVETEINREMAATAMASSYGVQDEFIAKFAGIGETKNAPITNLSSALFGKGMLDNVEASVMDRLFEKSGIKNLNLDEESTHKKVIDTEMDRVLQAADDIINSYDFQGNKFKDEAGGPKQLVLGNRKAINTFRHEIRYLINAIDEKLLPYTDKTSHPPRETMRLSPTWFVRQDRHKGKRGGPAISETTWPLLWQELIKKNLFAFQSNMPGDIEFVLNYKGEDLKVFRLPSDDLGVAIDNKIVRLNEIKPGSHKLGEYDLYELFTSEEGFWNDHTQVPNPKGYVAYRNVGDYNRVAMSAVINLRNSLSDSKRIEITKAWISKNLESGRVSPAELKMVFSSFIGNVRKSFAKNVEEKGYDGTTNASTPNLVLHKAQTQKGYQFNSILLQLMNEFDETLTDQYIELYNKYSTKEKDISFFPVGTDYLSTQKKYTARYRVMNTNSSVRKETREFRKLLKEDGFQSALEHFTKYLSDLNFFTYLHYVDGKELIYTTLEEFETNKNKLIADKEIFIELADVDTLLSSIGINPEDVPSAKERRLVLLFNNLSKAKNSFAQSGQGKLAHLMPMDVYADLYGIQYITPGVFLNRLIPNLLVIPKDFDQRAVKSDNVINWNKQMYAQAYTTSIIGNAGLEKYMMDKIQEHVLALQRSLGESLTEIGVIKDDIYNHTLGNFAYEDRNGNQVFYGANTAGKAQMEKDILNVAQNGFRGIADQPIDGLFAPGEFEHVGVEMRKNEKGIHYYVYKDLKDGKEYTDKGLFVDNVFIAEKYKNVSDKIIGYKKGVFDAALTTRRFFDLQITNVLYNTVEYLQKSASILKSLNHDNVNAKRVNDLANKWAKIRDEITTYNNDPSHDFTFTPHAWNHEDFESLYRSKRYGVIKNIFLKNKERVQKEGALNSAEQFLLNTNDEELEIMIEEYMVDELEKIVNAPRNSKLVYAGEYNKLRIDFEEGYITSLEMITAYSDTVMGRLKDDLIKTNYHMFMSTAGRMGEKHETIQTIRRFYYNELKDKDFAADYIKKSDIKKGDEISFNLYGTWTSPKGNKYKSENFFWGKVEGFTTQDGKRALKVKHYSAKDPITVPLEAIYTRDQGQNMLTNHIKVFREKGVAETYDHWARESGFNEKHKIQNGLAKAFIHSPKYLARTASYLHLGLILQFYAGLKNRFGGISSNLMGSVRNYFKYMGAAKKFEASVKSGKDATTSWQRDIWRALEELSLTTASNNTVMNLALQGDMDIDFTMLDISSSKMETVKALWKMWQDKAGFTEYRNGKRLLQGQYDRARTDQQRNEIREELRQLETDWQENKKPKGLDEEVSDETSSRYFEELEKGNLSEILNVDKKLAGKLLRKYFKTLYNNYAFKYFLKPEPWLRKTAFFIGYYDAIGAGLTHQEALEHGKSRSGVNQAHYGPKDRIIGATNEWGIAMTKFIQYGVRHFAKWFHMIQQKKIQTKMYGHKMPFKHYLEQKELVPFKILTTVDDFDVKLLELEALAPKKIGKGVNINKIMMATAFQSLVMQYILKYFGFYAIANLGDPFVQWSTGILEMLFALLEGDPPEELDRGQVAMFLSRTIPVAGWGATLPFMFLNEDIPESLFGKRNIEIIKNTMETLRGRESFDPGPLIGVERSYRSIYNSFYDF